MNKPIDPACCKPAEAFADYLTNTAARIDERAEAKAHGDGARVGISRPHESAQLHVAGEATYIDDIPELAGTLHCALGLSPVANGRLKDMKLDAIRAHARRGGGDHGRRHPGQQRLRIDRPRRPDPAASGDIRYLGQPVSP